MRGIWLLGVIGMMSAIGCTSTPKREMRQATAEEFVTLPENMYTTPREVPRDQPVLMPKAGPPGLNTGMPGGGPSMGPGGAGGPMAGARR